MRKSGLMLAAAATVLFSGTALAAGATVSASGQGSLDDGARTFSFSARQYADGTVTGQATIVNRSFTGENGKSPYRAHIAISCMNVDGDVVILGGMVTSTNDPNLDGAVFFAVEDNGDPGAGVDAVSRAYFWDDTPGATGDPSACLLNTQADYPREPISSGNVQVVGL